MWTFHEQAIYTQLRQLDKIVKATYMCASPAGGNKLYTYNCASRTKL